MKNLLPIYYQIAGIYYRPPFSVPSLAFPARICHQSGTRGRDLLYHREFIPPKGSTNCQHVFPAGIDRWSTDDFLKSTDSYSLDACME
jgi:hypothetical protein